MSFRTGFILGATAASELDLACSILLDESNSSRTAANMPECAGSNCCMPASRLIVKLCWVDSEDLIFAPHVKLDTIIIVLQAAWMRNNS